MMTNALTRKFALQALVFLCLTMSVICANLTIATAGGGHGESSSSHRTLIVTNWGDDTVSLVNVDSGEQFAVIDVGKNPYDVKVSPNGRFAYVTNSGSSSLSVVDIQAVLEDSKIEVGRSPRDIALFRDGSRAVVANAGDDSISIVNLESGRELYRVQVGAIPYGVALVDNDQVALVTNWGANTVSVVALGEESGDILSEIDVGSLPYTVVALPHAPLAYVSEFGSNSLALISWDSGSGLANTIRIAENITVPRSPWGIALSTDDEPQLAVAGFYSGKISIRNAMRGENARVLDLAQSSHQRARAAKNVAFTPSGDLLVVSELAINEILVVDPNELSVIRSIPVGKAPYGLAFFGAARMPQ